MAEGLATGAGFELPLSIVRGSLDEFLLVDGTVICDAVVTMLEHQHLLLEPAGASALAAALGNRERLAGCKVVLVCSGAHVTRVQLQALLDSR
jgi:threonine dehydratase